MNTTSEEINYNRIASAITFIRQNFKTQPTLDEIAEEIHLSPFHFQRIFTEWAGVSPKKFLQYISVEHAKQLLKEQNTTLSYTAEETGLSGTSRLHDLFIKIEGMTPGEYKNGGENLSINYSFAQTPFGEILIATTKKGICHMAFVNTREEAFSNLVHQFPKASLTNRLDLMQQNALFIFTSDWSKLNKISLHLRGTEFQLKVWETLLKIPMGQLSTYGAVAHKIQRAGASRAVGTAIGTNPVAYLIPCHRVIQSSGIIGNYMWGPDRKTAMIGWEVAKTNQES